jgi:hypothetical protein
MSGIKRSGWGYCYKRAAISVISPQISVPTLKSEMVNSKFQLAAAHPIQQQRKTTRRFLVRDKNDAVSPSSCYILPLRRHPRWNIPEEPPISHSGGARLYLPALRQPTCSA